MTEDSQDIDAKVLEGAGGSRGSLALQVYYEERMEVISKAPLDGSP